MCVTWIHSSWVRAHGIFIVAGGAVAQAPPNSTSVNPGWRKALHLVTFSERWTSSTPLSERDEIRQRVTDQTSLLDPFSEGLGAYLNEADAVSV